MQILNVIFLTLLMSPVQANGLEVGMAARDITPPVGVPLGGFGGGSRRLGFPDIFDRYKYAFFFKPSDGILDPIRAKVMAVRAPNQAPVVFVSVDVVGVTASLRADVAAKVGSDFDVSRLVLSATHTHSGPGTLSKNLMWQIIAMDRHVPKIYRAFIAGIADTIRDALLALEPAELLYSSFQAVNLQGNRRERVGHFDPQVQMLVAKNSSGQTLGGIVNYAVHGTFYGTDNHKFSADVAGALERELERSWTPSAGARPPVALFINGAEGDVSPHKMESDKSADDYAKRFAEQALPALRTGTALRPTIQVENTEVNLGSARLNARACVKQKFLRSLILKQFKPYLGFLMPKKTPVSRISIGELEMLSWPGEPTTSLGLELKQLATSMGHAKSMVLGLTQDHLGYFTTRDEYNGKTYEACSTLYGENSASKIMGELRNLLGR